MVGFNDVFPLTKYLQLEAYKRKIELKENIFAIIRRQLKAAEKDFDHLSRAQTLFVAYLRRDTKP